MFVTAGKPNLGLGLTILSGLANMVLDYVFIAVFGWGIAGAAWTTAVGYSIVSVFALFYFWKPRTEIMNIFISSLFTALSNGKVSAMISMIRTFGFTVAGILLFSWIWQMNGLWLAVPAAECATLVLALFQVKKYKKVYEY